MTKTATHATFHHFTLNNRVSISAGAPPEGGAGRLEVQGQLEVRLQAKREVDEGLEGTVHPYTPKTVYRVAICPRGNLPYIQIYPISNTIISSTFPTNFGGFLLKQHGMP